MSEWQPIETAPRDGSFILAWIKDEDGGHVEQLRYDLSAERSASGEFGPFVWGTPLSECGVWARDIVTHWMPLPSPPLPAIGDRA